MDDFNVSSLHESKNEWCSRLLVLLTPHIKDGFRSIFDEAFDICHKNNEFNKYLMTFQNFISRIPKWSPAIIEKEKNRIVERSGCNYLEDLITCIYVIQLKLLSAARAGSKQKKIDIDIPKLDDFVHKAYIECARKIYTNVYLFERIPNSPLMMQQHNRELEVIIQECILNTIREGIPVQSILKAYMEESVEDDVEEDIKEEIIHEDIETDHENTSIVTEQIGVESTNTTSNHIENNKEDDTINKQLETDISISTQELRGDNIEFPELSSENIGTLSFNNIDFVKDQDNKETQIEASKDIRTLEEISAIRNAERKSMEEEDDDDDDDASNVRLNISGADASLDMLDVHSLDNNNNIKLNTDEMLDDVEILA